MIQINITSVTLIGMTGNKILLTDIVFSMVEQNIYTILGKNGEGKTTLLKAITQLLDKNVFITAGSVEFEGVDLLSLPLGKLREVRKTKLQYVFQDSVNAFDPLKKLGYYFTLNPYDENEINKEFEFFNLPDPKKIYEFYPYEISGGMAQRIALILALLKKPKLLLLDEPTSGIDTETISLTKERLKQFVKQNNAAVLIITQDLSFANNMTDFIAFLEKEELSQFISYTDFFNQNSGSINNFLNAYKQLNDESLINH